MLKSAPESERAVDIILDLPSEELPIERVLGIQWSVGLACFGFSIVLKDQPLTRRGVPASVYDPLGFLAPLVLRAKKILQEICRRGVAGMSLCLKMFGAKVGAVETWYAAPRGVTNSKILRAGDDELKEELWGTQFRWRMHVQIRTMPLPYSGGWRRKRDCLISDGKVPCRSIEDYYYTKIGAHHCSSFRESWRDASRRIKLCQT